MSGEMAHLVTAAINKDAKELNDYRFRFEVDAIDLVPNRRSWFYWLSLDLPFRGAGYTIEVEM